jgi:hypothetical protein
MKKQQGYRPPDGAVRRSQLLTGSGPGSLVDLVDYAVVLKGLDEWQYSNDDDDTYLDEPRLQAAVLRTLKAGGQYAHDRVHLRRPPRASEDHPAPYAGIHAREFPIWFLCQSAGCGGIVRREAVEGKKRWHYCHGQDGKGAPAVPMRFIGACAKGHLQDLDWRRFVHHGQTADGAPDGTMCEVDPDLGYLRDADGNEFASDLSLITTGASGDLSEQLVRCRRCGRTRGLQDLNRPKALGTCLGWRPWLPSNDESCDQDLRLLTRTSSSAYFSHVRSALHIPEKHGPLKQKVREHWSTLAEADDVGDLATLFKLVSSLRNAFAGHEPAVVLEVMRELRSADARIPGMRETEWHALMDADWGSRGDLPPKGESFYPRRLADVELPAFLDRVVLVHALQEVRAQIGFGRLESIALGAEGEADASQARFSAPLALKADWVPAVEINGEGIFLAFDETAVRAWEASEAVQARERQFLAGLTKENAARSHTSQLPFGGARLVMLHSLAHLLITSISLECGYSASAIRERLYCHVDPEDPALSRAGILLYTGTPGSEGTLGGLVEVGRDIVTHLRRVVLASRICSNDPVCAQQSPDGLDDARRREGAACHACLLIAEPSCERMNRDLDRALVVPTIELEDAAFLGAWAEEEGLI